MPRHHEPLKLAVVPLHDGDDAEMFNLAPVSLWLEDYSGLKALFETWRQAGVTSLRDYLNEDPARTTACSDWAAFPS